MSAQGQSHGDDLRKVVDAIFYVPKTGCQWRMLPEGNGAVDATGLPVAATDVPTSTHDNDATAVLRDEAGWWGTTERLELVLRAP